MSLQNIAARTALRQTAQHFRHLGLEMPKKFTAELDRLTALDAVEHPRSDPRALGEAVAAAMVAGRDPAADSDVQTAIFREALAREEVTRALRQIVEDRRTATLAQHGPAIVEAMRPTADAADTVLARAHDELPAGTDYTDHNAVTTLRAGQLSLWGEARDALERVHRIVQVWTLVASGSELARVQPGTKPLILSDLSAVDLAALGRSADAEAAVRAGHRLTLATFTEYRDRVAATTQEAAESVRTAKQAADEHRRKSSGVTKPLSWSA